jgi:hypothetical protein
MAAPLAAAHQTSHKMILFPAVGHGQHYRQGQGAPRVHFLQSANGVVLETEASKSAAFAMKPMHEGRNTSNPFLTV